LHKRAAESTKETRGTVIKLTAGAIGVLTTREINPPLEQLERLIILSTIVFMVGALSAAIWFGFCDAQWSYWGVELDADREVKKKDNASKRRINGT
jgi:hypothetical protein